MAHPSAPAAPAHPAPSTRRLPLRAVALVVVLIGAVMACEAASTPTTTTTTAPGHAIDKTHLPLGDGKYSTTAKKGYIMACQTVFNGGGASARGPWFNVDGTTWDLTKKGEVDGAVNWTAQFTTSIVGAQRTFTGNDLPTHTTGKFPIATTDDVYAYDRNPGSISSQVLSVKIPASPTAAASPTCIHGEVGVLLSGAALFDGFDAGGRDAAAWEAQDHCGGHPQNTGVYHYHSITSCITTPNGKSTLVGFAYDGFPIYVEKDAAGNLPTNADLDECHGKTSAVPLDGKTVTTYHYDATWEFPYSVGCFKGTPAQNTFGGH